MLVASTFIFLAGGQFVSSRDPVSRDPLSAQVGDRRVATFRAFVVICMTRCWIFAPLQQPRAYLGESSIAQRKPIKG